MPGAPHPAPFFLALKRRGSQSAPRIEPPARWDALYAVTQTGDDGHTTTFALVPHAAGNVSKITVTVDGRALKLTNWDKVLFPETGFTNLPDSLFTQ